MESQETIRNEGTAARIEVKQEQKEGITAADLITEIVRNQHLGNLALKEVWSVVLKTRRQLGFVDWFASISFLLWVAWFMIMGWKWARG